MITKSIYAQFSSLYPDVVAKYGVESGNGSITTSIKSIANLDKHSKMQPPLCIPVAGQNWVRAGLGAIREGINYLNGLSGGCNFGARSCVRISCSWKSAIYNLQ